MWTEKKFNVTRREASTKRPFGEVVAAIEARAPVSGIAWTRLLLKTSRRKI
jgi:hypothetical protein